MNASSRTFHPRHADEPPATDDVTDLEAREPDSPTDLTKRSWVYVLRKTAREFSRDECTDLAAALTYYAVLAMFPAAIALISLVGLVGQGPQTVQTLLDVQRQAGAGSVVSTVEEPLMSLATAQRAAKIANAEGASSRGGKKSGSGGDSSQGGTTAQKKKAGRKGGKASNS